MECSIYDGRIRACLLFDKLAVCKGIFAQSLLLTKYKKYAERDG
jgi:hypothetical protein